MRQKMRSVLPLLGATKVEFSNSARRLQLNSDLCTTPAQSRARSRSLQAVQASTSPNARQCLEERARTNHRIVLDVTDLASLEAAHGFNACTIKPRHGKVQ